LVRQLGLVADQFATLLSELRLHTDDFSETREQSTLRRLLSGDAGCEEAVAAGLSFAGARLVVATLPDTQAALRALAPLRADRGSVAIWQPPEEVVVLVRGVPQRAGDDRGHRAASRVAAVLRREAPDAAVGVSSAMTSATQMQAARAEALEVARLAAGDPQSVAFADECWAQVATSRLARQVCRALPISNPLATLREYDETHRANLLRTLRVWLAANGDTAKTAELLSLHPNSLRYRIRRAQDVCGLDLNNADVRALAHIMLSTMEER
jgi:DNA-binding PucR family transcriptional regulator